jgi:hypothetical protein
MSHDRIDTLPLESPLGGLERALIDEFLHMRGQTPESLRDLAESERRALLGEASVYALEVRPRAARDQAGPGSDWPRLGDSANSDSPR